MTMKSIFDRSFRYTPSAHTNLKATFARVKRKLREEQELKQANELEAKQKVSTLKKKA